MNETYAQRMRVTFATFDQVKYVGHLDLARAFERAIRRARLPLAYTQGFNPQPRLQFAAALPVGFTSCGEVADVFLNEEMQPAELLERLAAALPPGIRPLHAEPVLRTLPSLQSHVATARYRIEVESGDDPAAFEASLRGFLARGEALRERRRGKERARYDLRPLVLDLDYEGEITGGHSFVALMRCSAGATGRPDEMLAELGYETAWRRVTRLGLGFGDALPETNGEAVQVSPITD